MYFDKETIIQSIRHLQGKVENKLFGLLSLFRLVDTEVVLPLRNYNAENQKIASWLNSVLTLEEINTNSYASHTFRFSIGWEKYISEEIKVNTSLLPLLVFIYKFEYFDHEISFIELKNKFINEFHLSEEHLSKFFDSENENSITLNFTNERTTRNQLKVELGMSKSTIGFEDYRELASKAGNLKSAPFFQTLYAGSGIIKCLMICDSDLEDYYPLSSQIQSKLKVFSEQIIYYGTPGSGKSFTIRRKYENVVSPNQVVRTTFHPDSDYTTFVGCYKPRTYIVGDEKKISYEFAPQAFTEAYIKAWSDPDNPYFLIIEEINRGNCAQIFGDLFQLLDRNKETGKSDYSITADNDLREYLEIALPKNCEGIQNGKLCLPPNLNIIASMNTSDQSLFPMDSAFKRRWAWKYVPIEYDNAISGKFEIAVGDEKINWHRFLFEVNEEIKKLTASEDKQMGNFFIKESIDEEEFVDKVMFYLWSEIGKDNYNTTDHLFYYSEDKDTDVEFSFNELFGIHRTKHLQGFIKMLEEKYGELYEATFLSSEE